MHMKPQIVRRKGDASVATLGSTRERVFLSSFKFYALLHPRRLGKMNLTRQWIRMDQPKQEQRRNIRSVASQTLKSSA